MKTTLDRYPGYTFIDGKVFSPKGKEIKETEVGFRVITAKGTRTSVSKASLEAQLLPRLELPAGSKPIPEEDGYFITTTGTVYSFDPIRSPNGVILTTHLGNTGYIRVSLKSGTIEVHNLMARTFLDADYRLKGLCVMHKDNNKANPALTNLCIGTYSENNQAAYDDGLQGKEYMNK